MDANDNEYDADIKIKVEEESDDSEPMMERSYKMNAYCKRMTLQHLQQDGMDLQKIFTKFKCPQEDIKNYIDVKAEDSQENVHFECGSETFAAIDSWLEKFKQGEINISFNEYGLIMKVIAECEEHADPEEAEGVNFKDLYRFLAKVMNGEPTTELDQPTKQFLWECFQELADEVNSETGDMLLEKFKTQLILNQLEPHTTISALDPLKIRFGE